MFTASRAFRAYVERAREGNTALWRTIAGVVVIALVWLAFSVAAAFPLFMPGGTADKSFFNTPAGLALTLGSFAGIWLGVWIAVRLVQRRSLASVLGASGRIARPDFVRALVATLATCLLTELATFAVDPTLSRSAVGLGEWLLWLIPAVLLVFVQTSAEEVSFRGYLCNRLRRAFAARGSGRWRRACSLRCSI